jgi:hypothetical protein
MAHHQIKTLTLRILADGSEVRFVSVDIKPRPQDDGNADFDEVQGLSPGLGDAFQQRRSSDFPCQER